MSGTTEEPLKREVPPDVLEFVQLIWAKVKPAIESGNESMPLVLFRMREDKKNVGIVPVADMINSQAGKAMITHIMTEAIKEEPIAIVVLVTEAWMAEVSAKEDLQLPVRDRPDRIECVLFNAMTKDEQFLGTAKINRTSGSPVLEPLSIFPTDDGSSEGTLVRETEKKIVH